MQELLEAIAEFFMRILDALLAGGINFLDNLAPIIEWIIWGVSSIPALFVAWLGWKYILKPAWQKNSMQFLAFGPDWWKMLARRIFLTAIFIGLTLLGIMLAGRLGNTGLNVLAHSMDYEIVSPPMGNATPIPALAPLLGDLDLDRSTDDSTTAPPADDPAPAGTTPAATPGANTGGGTHTVTDPTGASVRLPGDNGRCDDDDTPDGNISVGTTVVIEQTWPSNNIPGERGLTSTGVCVHLSALSPVP